MEWTFDVFISICMSDIMWTQQERNILQDWTEKTCEKYTTIKMFTPDVTGVEAVGFKKFLICTIIKKFSMNF